MRQKILFNQHVTDLKESATLLINTTVKSLRKQKKDVIHFGFGQSPFPVHPKIVAALKEAASEKDYLPTKGLESLREQIATYYQQNFGYRFKADNIIIGPGSKELLFQALFILEGTVIIPAPSWVSYGPQVSLRGKNISRVTTKIEDNYKLQASDLEQLCQSLTAPQKILIINSPNNPTGAVYSDQEIESLVEVCKEHNILVFSDEIYAQVDFTNQPKKGFYHFYPEGTLITAGLSKAHSAGGYRMGFLATSPQLGDVITYLASMVSETFSAVSAPIQYSAIKAYSNDPEIQTYIKKCAEIHHIVGTYLQEKLCQLNIQTPKPQGAFYLFPSFNQHRQLLKKRYNIKSATDLSLQLLSDKLVATLPGTDFYMPAQELNLRLATVDYDGAAVYQAALNEKLDFNFVEAYCPRIAEGVQRIAAFLNP